MTTETPTLPTGRFYYMVLDTQSRQVVFEGDRGDCRNWVWPRVAERRYSVIDRDFYNRMLRSGDAVVWYQATLTIAVDRPATVVDVTPNGHVRIITTDDGKRHTVKYHNLKKVS